MSGTLTDLSAYLGIRQSSISDSDAKRRMMIPAA